MSGNKKYASTPIISTNELAKQMQIEFQTPEANFDPISLKNDNQARKEIEDLTKLIAEGNEWDVQVKAISRAMSLINGGALEYDSFASKIPDLSIGLIAGSSNLRSALVKNSCLFISLLAHKLKKKFSTMGEMIMPLSKQTTHGTLIIAESCKLTILEIVKYCPIKNVFLSIIELSKSKAIENRQISAESFILMLTYWGKTLIEQNNDVVMKTLRLLLVDSSQEVRNATRIASKIFASKYPKYSDLFLATLDSKTKSAVLAAEVPPETPPIKQDQGDLADKKFEPASPIEPKVSGHLLLSPHSPKSYVEEVNQISEKQKENEENPSPPKMNFVQDLILDDTITPPEKYTVQPITTPKKPTKLPAKKKTPQQKVQAEPEDANKPSMIPVYDKKSDRSKSPALLANTRTIKPKMSSKHRSSSVRPSYKSDQIKDLRRNLNEELNNEDFQNVNNNEQKVQGKEPKANNKKAKANNTARSVKDPRRNSKSKQKSLTTEETNTQKDGKIINDIVEKVESPQKRKSEESMAPPRLIDQGNRRRSSNPNKKVVKRRSTIVLEDGNERTFVDRINEVIEMNNYEEITRQIKTIVPGLVITMNSKSSYASNKSLSLISLLIPQYKDEFQLSLQAIFDALFGGLLSDVIAKDNRDLMDNLLAVIKENYSPNDIIVCCSSQASSQRLVKYIESFINLVVFNDENKDIAKKIAQISVSQYETLQGESRKILDIIAKNSRQSLVEIMKTSDQKQKEIIKVIIDYVDNHYGECPQVDNDQNVDEMCKKVLNFAKLATEFDYNNAIDNLYQSLSDVVLQKEKEAAEKIFQCMINIVEMKGVDHFEYFARSCLKHSERSKIVNVLKLLDIIECKAGGSKTITFLISSVKDDNENSPLYIDELQRCIKMNTEMMRLHAQTMTEMLCKEIDNENIYLRKSIVFCIALIVKTYGENADKIVRTLELPKQRLISIYINK